MIKINRNYTLFNNMAQYSINKWQFFKKKINQEIKNTHILAK